MKQNDGKVFIGCRINAELYQKVKSKAKDEGMKLRKVLTDALEQYSVTPYGPIEKK